MKTELAGHEDGPPIALIQAAEVLEKTGFGNEKPNPIEPFMREVFLPQTLAFMHSIKAVPGVLGSFLTDRIFVGASLSFIGGSYFFDQLSCTLFATTIAGAILGDIFLKREKVYQARDFALKAFRFIW